MSSQAILKRLKALENQIRIEQERSQQSAEIIRLLKQYEEIMERANRDPKYPALEREVVKEVYIPEKNGIMLFRRPKRYANLGSANDC